MNMQPMLGGRAGGTNAGGMNQCRRADGRADFGTRDILAPDTYAKYKQYINKRVTKCEHLTYVSWFDSWILHYFTHTVAPGDRDTVLLLKWRRHSSVLTKKWNAWHVHIEWRHMVLLSSSGVLVYVFIFSRSALNKLFSIVMSVTKLKNLVGWKIDAWHIQ